MKAYEEWRYSSTHSLTSARYGGEWSASCSGRFTPRERAPGTHWIGGCVGPRAILDAVVKRKIPSPRRESKPRTPIVQPVAQRYTDWAITALPPVIYGYKILVECWLAGKTEVLVKETYTASTLLAINARRLYSIRFLHPKNTASHEVPRQVNFSMLTFILQSLLLLLSNFPFHFHAKWSR
jgi:hypothetical protein